VSLLVQTFGTGTVPETRLAELVREHFDARPGALIRELDLRRPIFRKTSNYGHFGRSDPDFTWERTDRAAALKDSARTGTVAVRPPARNGAAAAKRSVARPGKRRGPRNGEPVET
jgi:hypothetical protein